MASFGSRGAKKAQTLSNRAILCLSGMGLLLLAALLLVRIGSTTSDSSSNRANTSPSPSKHESLLAEDATAGSLLVSKIQQSYVPYGTRAEEVFRSAQRLRASLPEGYTVEIVKRPGPQTGTYIRTGSFWVIL